MIEHLSFSVTGKFVTETARDWLFKEFRPYEEVEEFLLSCLCGTELSRDELVDKAQNILLGRAEMIGNTADGSYDYRGIHKSGRKDDIFHCITTLQEKLKRYQDDYAALMEQVNYCIESDFELSSYINDTGKNHEEHYGFLSPDCKFTQVDFGNHLDWARDYVDNSGLHPEYWKWYKNKNNRSLNGLEVDFLVEVKGWILFHNTAGVGIAYPEYEDKLINKQQREYLFDFYIKNNQQDKANDLYKEF